MNRRGLLAAAASSALLARAPLFAAGAPGSEDRTLRAALDSLSGLHAPEAKLDRLTRFSTTGLSRSAALDLETVRAGLRIDAALARHFPFGKLGRSPYSVSLASGAWRDARSVSEAGAAALADRIDAETAAIEADARAGTILPTSLLNRTIAGIRGAVPKATGRLANALAGQGAALERLAPQSDAAPGVWRLRDGETYFAQLLERQGGEAVDPGALHDRLMAKWHELRARADALLRRQGLSRGSVGNRIIAFARQERWLYGDDSAGRDRAVADMNRWLDRARVRVPALFGDVPDICRDVSVRRMSASDEAARRQGYRVVPGPGRSGAYYVDLADIRRRPSWSLPGVVHHELLPGHMIQLPIEQLADPHPLRLEYAPAFVEGWAVYAEQLAAAHGAFDDAESALLGHTHWLLFRIGRAVIDTGVHYKRWSFQAALQTLGEVQGEPAHFAPFATDIDRICLEPGIRAAEALNWLRLTDMFSAEADSTATSTALRHYHRILLADGRKRLETVAAELRKPGQLS